MVLKLFPLMMNSFLFLLIADAEVVVFFMPALLSSGYSGHYTAKSSKDVTMAPSTDEIHLIDFIVNLVNQQPVRFDVAFKTA